MNTANLQLEGLYLAIAAINNALVIKGVLSREEVDTALRTAEATATIEDQENSKLSPALKDAIVFPLRLLQLANNSASEDGTVGFKELARFVGQTKD